MIKRTLDISHPSYLKCQQAQLLIEQRDALVGKVPFEDLGVLILSHPQILLTQGVIQACSEHNCVIIHCDQKHLPISLTLPLFSHSLHTKTLRNQIGIKPVRRKQLWQQIVQGKIDQQAQTLQRLGKNHQPIQAMIQRVKSDDKNNTEAQAAQRYWKLLFDKPFKRNPDDPGTNAQLNYGYAIVRAVIARAIVATGFHPSLGLKHSNQYNPYCLADDLMEPFRPWIDEITYHQPSNELNRHTKAHYLTLLSNTVSYKDKKTPFMVAIGTFIADIKQAYEDGSVPLQFPQRPKEITP